MTGDPRLTAVFGEANDTARVLNTPSGVSREMASSVIDSLDLDVVLRDVGTILAREIANALESMALRPADYADLPDMVRMVAARLGGELATAPPEFAKAFIEQLRLRG